MGFCGKWYKKDGSFNAYGNIREVSMVYEVFVKGKSRVGRRIIDRFVGAYDTLEKAEYHAQQIDKLIREDLCGIELDLAEWHIDIRNSETYEVVRV